MKSINTFFVVAMFLSYSVAIFAKPLTIINATIDTIIFTIGLSSGNKRVAVKANEKWFYDLADKENADKENFVSLKWDGFVIKKDSLERDIDPIKCHFDVKVSEVMPDVATGGSVVVSKDGYIMYDPKKGKVHFVELECGSNK